MQKAAKKSQSKTIRFERRKHRVNTIIKATATAPRLVISRSLTHIYAQIIDVSGNVLASANDLAIKGGTKSERAYTVGENLAHTAQKLGITTVVFDRNGYLYHGRVKQLAE